MREVSSLLNYPHQPGENFLRGVSGTAVALLISAASAPRWGGVGMSLVVLLSTGGDAYWPVATNAREPFPSTFGVGGSAEFLAEPNGTEQRV